MFRERNGVKRTAGLIGVPESTVRDWKRLWKADCFTLTPRFQYKGKLSIEERQQILSLRQSGQNMEAIAHTLGRSSNMVARFLHQTLTNATLSATR